MPIHNVDRSDPESSIKSCGYYADAVLELIEEMQVKGDLMDAKSANGMMALKNLTTLKDQISNGNCINDESFSTDKEDVEKFMKLEKRLRRGLPSLRRLTRFLVTKETEKLWAKQDWAFMLLCIELHE